MNLARRRRLPDRTRILEVRCRPVDPDVPDSRAASAACSVSGTTIVVRGPVDIATVRWLCERVRLVLGNSDVATIVCDVASCLEPDASTVDALARSSLTARRLGRGFVLGDCSPRLADLLTLLGLADVLPVRPHGSVPQPIRRLPG